QHGSRPPEVKAHRDPGVARAPRSQSRTPPARGPETFLLHFVDATPRASRRRPHAALTTPPPELGFREERTTPAADRGMVRPAGVSEECGPGCPGRYRPGPG